MTAPAAWLAFMKLNVPDLRQARAFWESAFGFVVVRTYDEDSFIEHIMEVPGSGPTGLSLMLVERRPPRKLEVGDAHGPVGLVCEDIAASYAHALDHGAFALMEPTDVGGVLVAMLKAPQGHQIELVQPLD